GSRQLHTADLARRADGVHPRADPDLAAGDCRNREDLEVALPNTATTPAPRQSSATNVSARFFRIAGSSTEPSSRAAIARRHALSGSVSSTSARPSDSTSARRTYSSIGGPRTKPSSSGVGWQPSLWNT